jgi:hypothetical protein
LQDFLRNRGKSFVASYPRHSTVSLIMNSVYTDHEFHPWLFSSVPRGFWDLKENRITYIRWLKDVLGINKDEKLIWKHLVDNRGSGLMAKYGGAVELVLNSLNEDSTDKNISRYDAFQRPKMSRNTWVRPNFFFLVLVLVL